ncbi:MAG TPA: hypothetical protein VJI98_02420 [Candidatus Nanoarchaeia archaeon]|nr:hypothetical protein [Candidatus Nanoarchaeia archaeon]
MTNLVEQAKNDGYIPTMGGAYKIGDNGAGVPFLLAVPVDRRDFVNGKFTGRLYEAQGHTNIEGMVQADTLVFSTSESPSRNFEAQMKPGISYQGKFSIDSRVLGIFQIR